ncbi:hypothetical protein [Arachidicoccus sp.]|jgi:hypothetical protein|uniref:hypothetical protein n=1 Tax=Arachidicoccus sp. TaxID=1872624 RepID=UPI003D1B91F3
MNKNKYLYILYLGIIFAACTKIVPGFLSDTLGYTQKEIICTRGLAYDASEKINFDGSTPPVKFELINLRDSLTGQSAPKEFDSTYDVTQFKPGQTFDAQTDTTIALLNAKRESVKLKPYFFNQVSGQFVFNHGSAHLPTGMYCFDIKATNVHGVKIYPSAGYIHVLDPTDDDLYEVVYTACSASNDATGTFTTMKNIKFSITKISSDNAITIVKIVDKNGVPFNPKNGEVITRGDRPYFGTYAKFHPITYTDTAMICNFEVAPFPLANYVDNAGTDWGFLQYYRIPSKYIAIDNMPSTNGFSANPVFSFQLKLEGTYEIVVQMTDATHK